MSTSYFIFIFLLCIYYNIPSLLAAELNYIDYDDEWEKLIPKKKIVNPDTYLNTIQLITKYGYPAESHKIKTEDGYLLTLHRIPHGHEMPHDTSTLDKPVVFLQHGFLSSSADWIIPGPSKSLAYLLADRGYDVWLGNIRGNTASKGHVHLSTDNRKFWDFSFDEMGYYDLPAMIDYVLDRTGERQLSYIGHSMGTTMFYAMGSSKPEYNDKIRVMVSLAPVAYLSNAKSFVKYTASLISVLRMFKQLFGGNGEFLSKSDYSEKLMEVLCENAATTCKTVAFFGTGFDNNQFNMSLYPVILSHRPAGTSFRTLLHFIQIYENGKFKPYDCSTNWWHVTELFTRKCVDEPPVHSYNLSHVTAPITLHYSENDWIVHQKDLDKLRNQLPNVIGTFKIPFSSFNHIDFLYAIDAPTLVYDKVFEVLETAANLDLFNKIRGFLQSR